jgi:hypothetical protein
VFSSVALDGIIVFAGGRDFAQQPLDRVDLFHEAEQTWEQATLSLPRWHLAAAAAGDTALFAGRPTQSASLPPLSSSRVLLACWCCFMRLLLLLLTRVVVRRSDSRPLCLKCSGILFCYAFSTCTFSSVMMFPCQPARALLASSLLLSLASSIAVLCVLDSPSSCGLAGPVSSA